MTRVVVVGGGGREHALAWGLRASADVVVTPGNDGIAAHGIACTPAPATALDADLYVIGPEVPLVEGLADRLRAAGKLVFGPGADGARLEGSKAYLKEFLAAAGVATAAHGTFDDVDAALAYLAAMAPPYVIKTDGLAAGKGVLVTTSRDEAAADVVAKLSGAAFGAAGRRVVIEEGLVGTECSLMLLCDGERAAALVPAQDFKRVGEGDQGANTGGMGAFAPLALDAVTRARVDAEIVAPTLAELRRRRIDYRGVLYAGLMLTDEGPKLLEYNVRFGDPETQVLVPLVRDDLLATLAATAAGHLDEAPAPGQGAAVTVVLAAPGYPEAPRAGGSIRGLGPDGQLADPVEGVVVFHAGTRHDGSGGFVAAGGRVLSVTAHAPTLADARARAYEAAGRIDLPGMVWRHDIAAGAA